MLQVYVVKIEQQNEAVILLNVSWSLLGDEQFLFLSYFLFLHTFLPL